MLEFILRWFCRILIEICAYLVIDHLVCESVRLSCCNSADRKWILVIECMALFPACGLIRLNHTPYLLLFMTSATLFCAFFCPNFRIIWEKVVSAWNEFLAHQEQLQNDRRKKGPASPELLSRFQPAVERPSEGNGDDGPHVDHWSGGLTAGQHGLNMSNTGDQVYGVGDTQPQTGDTIFNNRRPDDATGLNWGPSASSQAACGGEGPQCHSNADSEKPQKTGVFYNISNLYNKWFSPGSYDGRHPPGIINPTAVCFMNCILQTLSRTPRLVGYIDGLVAAGVVNSLDAQQRRFFREIHAVFCLLTKRDADSSGQACFYKSAIETGNLRREISELNNLVVAPGSERRQCQQDAGEFLTWLLDRLDEVMVTGSHIQTTQESLRRLRDKCNDPSPADIALRRQQCHLQISLANGRNSGTYLFPASMLSDLEWLVYKEPKRSVISDVFQGQEVSALFCDTCEHISLSFHQFNVILLPIPTDAENIVRIEDCFRQAIAVSILSGPNRRQCDFCNSQTQGPTPSGNTVPPAGNIDTSTPNGPLARRPVVDCLSPIPRVDHGPPSTPCPQRPSLTDGQKQMSYRHLPDCLIVQLLRFDSSMRKILKRVQVSDGPVDLSFLDMIRIGVAVPRLYRLYGVCMHSGGQDMESGHYTSFSLADDGKWYHFSDHKVRAIGNINQELDDDKIQQSIYILFYRRVEHAVH